MQIPTHRLPLRDYQQEIVTNLNSNIRQAVLVVARRGAKTYTVFVEYIIPEMVREVMNVVIVYPTLAQGFKNFWNNIENDGFKTLEHIPKELILRQGNSEDDMRLTLINGSTLMVLGATNAEALRGANARIYFFDEFVDIPSGSLGVVRPITNMNAGKIIIASTPKQDGISGNTFKRLHDAALKRTDQYTCYVPGDRFMTSKQMEILRQDYVDEYGNDFLYKQEVLLDWGQSSSSSYYGEIMSKKDHDGTMAEFPHNPAHPVYTSWDLGRADNMVILFWQYYDKKVRIIDMYETQNFGLNSVIPFLQTKPYNYGWHFLPHDGAVHSANDNVSRLEYLHKAGLSNASVLRREGVGVGINRVLEGLPKVKINLGMVGDLPRKLRIYKRKFNPVTGDYVGPDHKSESHTADCIRYLFAAIHYYFNEKGEFLYSPDLSQKEYDSDLVTVPFY